jgi:hypothetical protein
MDEDDRVVFGGAQLRADLLGRDVIAIFELNVLVLDAEGGADSAPALGEFAVGDDQGPLAWRERVDDARLGGGRSGADY